MDDVENVDAYLEDEDATVESCPSRHRKHWHAARASPYEDVRGLWRLRSGS